MSLLVEKANSQKLYKAEQSPYDRSAKLIEKKRNPIGSLSVTPPIYLGKNSFLDS